MKVAYRNLAPLCMACLGLCAASNAVVWDNDTGNRLWSDPTNWSDNANGIQAGGMAVFADTAPGESVMDKAAAFVLGRLVYTNTLTNAAVAYSLNLAASKLVVTAGVDVAAFPATNASVTTVISNGTLRPAGLTIAWGSRNAALTGTLALATATFDSASLTNLVVGRHDLVNNFNANRVGLLDLSNAICVYGTESNKLRVSGPLDIGYGTLACGRLLLPSGLANFTITGAARLGN
jgi:hypothetical protein